MSIHIVPYPTGIDYVVAKIQRYLYERLYVQWGTSGMTGDMLQVYGRVYRNSTADGFSPFWYTGLKNYTVDLFYNDKIQAMLWFGLNDPMDIDGERATYKLSLYVFCNVTKVRPVSGQQRMDEAVIRDVLNLLQCEPFGFITKQVQRDIDNVLSKYTGKAKDESIINQNHQPKLCFRIDGEVSIALDDYGDCQPSVMPQNFNTMTGAIRVQIKANPDPTVMQTLVNGVQIPLEYPTGTTLTIPHLSGRYVFPNVILNNNNMDGMPYNPATQTFSYDSFNDGDLGLIYYNENN